MVKVTPKTYRTLVKCLKIMEEKGQEVPDFSLEMELEEAVKFFSKLLKEDSNNEVVFELQHEKEEKEVSKKESETLTVPKQKEKEKPFAEKRNPGTQNKIIEILKCDGTATIPQLMEKMQMGENAVRTSCYHLVKKGIIKRPRRGMYELVEKSELEVQKQMKEPREDSGEPQSSKQSETEELKSSSEDSVKQEENGELKNPCADLAPEKQEEHQLPEGKKQEQNLAEAKSENLFTNWKYYEVVDYIFTKRAFTVEKLRKSLSTKSNEIVEAIQLALKEGCITETEQDGRYRVEDIFRLYYFLLKTNRPIPYSRILADFRGDPDVLGRLLKESCEKGLVRIREIHKTPCYEAIE